MPHAVQVRFGRAICSATSARKGLRGAGFPGGDVAPTSVTPPTTAMASAASSRRAARIAFRIAFRIEDDVVWRAPFRCGPADRRASDDRIAR
ncbi:hypothetical protein EEJ42_07070 [Streptomyces botrytidirepellens]|uniref:Uncharacterized protein n=1 Tax=Streptomyces botrytidirepellens TaxID=2486417 RepID=A0A3M8WTT2_9ACTN|nr:hypothetical protein EEJ42_07070 [Streptomyces botrytidirepellens]